MRLTSKSALALLAMTSLSLMLCLGPVAAQEESTSAEDGAPASSAPAETSPVPTVTVGANLTPPTGALPNPPLIPAPGQGQAGSSTVSMAPGTQTTGIAREGANATRERRPDSAPADTAPADTAPESDSGSAPVATCADYPTWYDAQLALESSVDPDLMASLDPDGNTIACEEVMYPGS
jgi:hypothetical protein